MRLLLALLIPFVMFGQDMPSAELQYLRSLYEDLHRNPELSFHEEKTSQKLSNELRQLGFEITTAVGGYGIVGVLKNGAGPTILIRTDMDALPVVEETGKPYASTVKTQNDTGQEVGVMHACGHDMHMTVWTGTARALAKNKATWKGTVVFIGQPAEERSGGAKAMLKDGLLQRFPTPDMALALHVSPSIPTGTVGICPGYSMAFVDFMDITIYGRGGHGAYPHTTIDPVVLASRLVLDLQTIVSREISPLEPAVVTVGAIHGGAKGNVIPNEVKLRLTMRSYNDEVRNVIIEKIKRIGDGLAIATGIPEDLMPKYDLLPEFCPSVYNDPIMSAQVESLIQKAIGKENVQRVDPVMAGEDFSFFSRTPENIPCHLFWLGAVEPELLNKAQAGEVPAPSLHNSRFAPDPDPTIKTGVAAMTATVMGLLENR